MYFTDFTVKSRFLFLLIVMLFSQESFTLENAQKESVSYPTSKDLTRRVQISWGDEFQTHPKSRELRRAFMLAVNKWTAILDLSTEIKLYAGWEDLGGIVGQANLGRYVVGSRTDDAGYNRSVKIPPALSLQLDGYNDRLLAPRDLFALPQGHHIGVVFSRQVLSKTEYGFSFALGAESVPHQYHFVDVALHELCHAFGFFSHLRIDGSWDKDMLRDYPTVFDACIGVGTNEQVDNPITDLSAPQRIARSQISPLAFLGYNVRDYVEDTFGCVGPGLLLGCHIQMENAKIVSTPAGSSSMVTYLDSYHHWLGEAYVFDLIMVPSAPSGVAKQDIDIEHRALADMGWPLQKAVLFPPYVALNTTSSQKSAEPLVTTFKFYNYGDAPIENLSAQLLQGTPPSFEITAGAANASLDSFEVHEIQLSCIGATPGFHLAHLLIRYEDNGETKQEIAQLNLHIADDDSDLDGICDADEALDLDPDTAGIQNPFSSSSPEGNGCLGDDCLGDNGAVGGDGLADGENDWDGDGYSNSWEFQHGYNPLIAESDLPNQSYIEDGTSKKCTITNSAGFELLVTNPHIEGADKDSFVITSPEKAFTLAPGASHFIYCAFVPCSVGDKNDANLVVEYCVGGRTFKKRIPLSGTAGSTK